MAASVHVLAEPPAVAHVDSHSILQRRDSVYIEDDKGEKQKVCSLSFQEECQALEQRLKSHERGVLNPDSAGVHGARQRAAVARGGPQAAGRPRRRRPRRRPRRGREVPRLVRSPVSYYDHARR